MNAELQPSLSEPRLAKHAEHSARRVFGGSACLAGRWAQPNRDDARAAHVSARFANRPDPAVPPRRGARRTRLARLCVLSDSVVCLAFVSLVFFVYFVYFVFFVVSF